MDPARQHGHLDTASGARPSTLSAAASSTSSASSAPLWGPGRITLSSCPPCPYSHRRCLHCLHHHYLHLVPHKKAHSFSTRRRLHGPTRCSGGAIQSSSSGLSGLSG